MKGNESKKEKKKESDSNGKTKVLTDYQREKSGKQDMAIIIKPKI